MYVSDVKLQICPLSEKQYKFYVNFPFQIWWLLTCSVMLLYKIKSSGMKSGTLRILNKIMKTKWVQH